MATDTLRQAKIDDTFGEKPETGKGYHQFEHDAEVTFRYAARKTVSGDVSDNPCNRAGDDVGPMVAIVKSDADIAHGLHAFKHKQAHGKGAGDLQPVQRCSQDGRLQEQTDHRTVCRRSRAGLPHTETGAAG